MQKAAALACLSLVGCSQVFGLSEPARAIDAAVDTDPTPDAFVCTSASLECTSADVLRTCSPGVPPVDTTCGWGCTVGGCARLMPAGSTLVVGDLDEMAGLDDVTIAANATINTDTGSITGVRADGAGINAGIRFEARGNGGVFTFASLQISATLTVAGTRPLMIVSRGEVTISALVDLRGTCVGVAAGPGGGRGGMSGENGNGAGGGDSDGQAAGNADNGGGGASYGSTGGGGGDMDPGSGGGGAAGAVYGGPTLTPLLGGSGGAGGSDGAGGGVGGGGGGAVQVVSNEGITIASTGGINAGGCGGKPGNGGDSGGGGGSGGAILLEAPVVIVSGVLAANGGGGGGADGGSPGSAGGLSSLPAPGGPSPAGDGGAGAAGTIVDGTNGADDTLGGGGGGGLGRIRVNTRNGTGVTIGGSGVVSPAFTTTAATQGAASAK